MLCDSQLPITLLLYVQYCSFVFSYSGCDVSHCDGLDYGLCELWTSGIVL